MNELAENCLPIYAPFHVEAAILSTDGLPKDREIDQRSPTF